MTTAEVKVRKRALRREMVARILALEPAERRRQEAELSGRFGSLPGLDGAGTVLLYATAFPEELQTRPMLRLVLEGGRRLVCPRVDRASRRLVLHEVRDPEADLRPGVLAIPEPSHACPEVAPAAVDWVLVPGLAFDARGHRLGRGAGHYDRLLTRLRPRVPRWALALEPQWVRELPTEPHDQRLDGVATPSRCVAFGGRRAGDSGEFSD